MVEFAPVAGNPHNNIHLITNIFGPVGGQHQAIDNQANSTANAQHVGSKTGGGFAIYFKTPFNTRQAAVIFNVHKATQGAHLILDLIHVSVELAAISTTDQK